MIADDVKVVYTVRPSFSLSVCRGEKLMLERTLQNHLEIIIEQSYATNFLIHFLCRSHARPCYGSVDGVFSACDDANMALHIGICSSAYAVSLS